MSTHPTLPRLIEYDYAPTKGTSIVFVNTNGPLKHGQIRLDICLYPPGTIRRRGNMWIVHELRDDGSPDFVPILKEELDLYLKKRAFDEELDMYVMDRIVTSNKKPRRE